MYCDCTLDKNRLVVILKLYCCIKSCWNKKQWRRYCCKSRSTSSLNTTLDITNRLLHLSHVNLGSREEGSQLRGGRLVVRLHPLHAPRRQASLRDPDAQGHLQQVRVMVRGSGLEWIVCLFVCVTNFALFCIRSERFGFYWFIKACFVAILLLPKLFPFNTSHPLALVRYLFQIYHKFSSLILRILFS